MASVAQLVSELAHSLGQPNNFPLRENLKSLVIHTRNEVIRHSYENHGYVDKGLVQRFKVSLIDVYDGDITKLEEIDFEDLELDDLDISKIKRTEQKVPKPIRLTNNLPFDRVSSVGFKTNRVFPFIKESSARFRKAVPGLCGIPCYDYINGYIYIFPVCGKEFELQKIIIESAFEHPTFIQIQNGEIDELDVELDLNEWVLSEDMIGQIKEIIYKRDLLQTVRQTDEIPNAVKFNG